MAKRPDKVEIYKSPKRLFLRQQYRARVIAGNGFKLFVSAEGYTNVGDLIEVVDRLFPTLEKVYMGFTPEFIVEGEDK